MADPSQMFAVPTQVEGPLAGYMRGIMGDYGIQQQDQAAEQRRIANEAAQLALETSRKEVPLQDAERGNKLWTAQDDAAAIASGQAGLLRQGARDVMGQEQETKLTLSKIVKMESAADTWIQADNVMQNASPANKEELWTQLKSQAEALGIKNFPKDYNADTQSFLHTRAEAAISGKEFLQKQRILKQQGDQQMAVTKQHGQDAIAAAQANYGGANARADAALDPAKRALNKIQAKPVLDMQDLENATAILKKEVVASDADLKQLPEDAKTTFRAESSDGKKKLNKEVGLPVSNTDPSLYSKARYDATVTEKAKPLVAAMLQGKVVEGPTGEQMTVPQALAGSTGGVAPSVAKAQAKTQAKPATKTLPPPEGMTPEQYKKVKDLGYSDAKIRADWAARQATKPAAPMAPPMQAEPPVDQSQLYVAP